MGGGASSSPGGCHWTGTYWILLGPGPFVISIKLHARSLWAPPTAAYSPSTLVTCVTGLHHGPSNPSLRQQGGPKGVALQLRVESKKLGPFPIRRVNSPTARSVQLPRAMRVHPIFHISRIKPVHENPLDPAHPSPPPPLFFDGGPVYAVCHLIRSQCRGRGLYYLVD